MTCNFIRIQKILKNKIIISILFSIFSSCFLFGCAPSIVKNNQNNQTDSIILPTMRNDQLKSPTFNLKRFPDQVALLLPLSGTYKREGESILNGFLSAHYSLNKDNQVINNINVYDTQKYNNIEEAYDLAVQEGAKFIVGPLLQESVKELSGKIALSTPVLSLNSIDNDNPIIGMYQFSLSSIDEVISTSNKVISDQNKYGIIIMPDNELGHELREIYTNTFQSMGGSIIHHQSYNPENQDFSEELKELLSISNSEKRYSRLSANLNEYLAYNPRRRQDIDFIFLLATDTTNAKLLKSQLNYHLSGDKPIPVYSTSNIFSFNTDLNDLDGIIFTDAPWVIDQQTWLADLPSKLRKYWPGDAIQSRQNAMGYDAYFLVSELNTIKSNNFQELNGATGQLYMTDNGKIRRRLAWAKLVNGTLQIHQENNVIEQ